MYLYIYIYINVYIIVGSTGWRRHPAPITQHPAPNNQLPAPSTQHPPTHPPTGPTSAYGPQVPSLISTSQVAEGLPKQKQSDKSKLWRSNCPAKTSPGGM